jgi:hypothetical protein
MRKRNNQKRDWIPKQYELPDSVEAIEAGRQTQGELFTEPTELELIRQGKDK